MQPIRVVAALIVREGRVLLDRRPDRGRHAGLWEFPGGKVDPGETDAEALARELREELGVEAVVGRSVGAADDGAIALVLYAVALEGEPRSAEGQAIAWFEPSELEALPMPPADRPLIADVRVAVAEGRIGR